MTNHVRRAWTWFSSTHAWRAWQNYTDTRGPLLSGGIAYTSMFTLAATLLLGFTMVGSVLRGNEPLQRDIANSVNHRIPNLIDVGAGGMVKLTDLANYNVLSLTGFVAMALALWSGLGWTDSMREAVRAAFDLPPDKRPLLQKKSRDLLVMGLLALSVLVPAGISIAGGPIAGYVLGLMDLDQSAFGRGILRVISVAVVFAVDLGVMAIFLRILSGVRMGWVKLRRACLIGALGCGLIKLVAGLLLAKVGQSNPLLASGAVLVGLLVMLNLLANTIYWAACWAATDTQQSATDTQQSAIDTQQSGTPA